MCKECHEKMSPEEILRQIKDTLNVVSNNVAEFENWNTTSVSHLVITMSGQDGIEAKEIAVKLFEKFLNWYEWRKWDEYFPKKGLENMYPKKCLRKLLEIVRNSSYEIHPKDLEQMLFEEMAKYSSRKSVFITDDVYLQMFATGFITTITVFQIGLFICSSVR